MDRLFIFKEKIIKLAGHTNGSGPDRFIDLLDIQSPWIFSERRYLQNILDRTAKNYGMFYFDILGYTIPTSNLAYFALPVYFMGYIW